MNLPEMKDPVLWDETIKAIRDAGHAFSEAAGKIFNRTFAEIRTTLSHILDVFEAVGEASLQANLHHVASPREWHLYKHSKKKRVREKYRKRLTRRLRS